MKTKILSFLLLLIAGATLIPANAAHEDKISETRNVTGFSSIRLEGVSDIIFTQSSDYSLRIEGTSEYVNKTVTTVKNGVLIINYAEQKCNVKNVKIFISAPNLKKVKIGGVGSFTAEKLELDDVIFALEGVGGADVADLHCKHLHIALEGVGNVKMHIACETLKVNTEGVGNVKLTGTAGKAEISKGGVGGVNTKGLIIGR